MADVVPRPRRAVRPKWVAPQSRSATSCPAPPRRARYLVADAAVPPDYDELYVTFTDPTDSDTDDDTTVDGSDTTPLGTPTEFPVADAALVGTFTVTQIAPTGSAVAVDTRSA